MVEETAGEALDVEGPSKIQAKGSRSAFLRKEKAAGAGAILGVDMSDLQTSQPDPTGIVASSYKTYIDLLCFFEHIAFHVHIIDYIYNHIYIYI